MAVECPHDPSAGSTDKLRKKVGLRKEMDLTWVTTL